VVASRRYPSPRLLVQAFVLVSLLDRVKPKRVANRLIEQQCLRSVFGFLTPNLRFIMLGTNFRWFDYVCGIQLWNPLCKGKVRVYKFRKYLNAIHVLSPSFLLNENLLSLRRLALTLGASRNERFLLVHIRFVRSVMHDRLEHNVSVARLLAQACSQQ
jgi:hypothetical protein